MSAYSPHRLPNLDDNIATMMKMAAEHKRAARVALSEADDLRLTLETKEFEATRLGKQAADFYAGADSLRAIQARMIGAAENPWFEEAEVCFNQLTRTRGYRLIDVPNEGPSHEIEVIHTDGEKIATIVCVKPMPETPVRFTVAGWRTGNGSPALPFDNMVDVAVAVGELTRWDPTGDSQLKNFQFDGNAHKLDALGNHNREPVPPSETPTEVQIVNTVSVTVDPALEKMFPGTLARSVADMARRLEESGQPGNRL